MYKNILLFVWIFMVSSILEDCRPRYDHSLILLGSGRWVRLLVFPVWNISIWHSALHFILVAAQIELILHVAIHSAIKLLA